MQKASEFLVVSVRTCMDSKNFNIRWQMKKVKVLRKSMGGKVATIRYCKVAKSRPVYYSILETFVQSSQYVSIKFPLHKHSKMLGCATKQDMLLPVNLRFTKTLIYIWVCAYLDKWSKVQVLIQVLLLKIVWKASDYRGQNS